MQAGRHFRPGDAQLQGQGHIYGKGVGGGSRVDIDQPQQEGEGGEGGRKGLRRERAEAYVEVQSKRQQQSTKSMHLLTPHEVHLSESAQGIIPYICATHS